MLPSNNTTPLKYPGAYSRKYGMYVTVTNVLLIICNVVEHHNHNVVIRNSMSMQHLIGMTHICLDEGEQREGGREGGRE